MTVRFDGSNCVHEGPQELAAGSVTLEFANDAEGSSSVALLRLIADYTAQDMIDYLDPQPSTKHAPGFAVIQDRWHTASAGESLRWTGELEPGIHTIVCSNQGPFAVWFGAGFTVVERPTASAGAIPSLDAG